MLKKLVKVVVFLLIGVTIFVSFMQVFSMKLNTGMYQMSNFYNEEEDSIDVMFFGTSHVYTTVNTTTLWDDYGIAAYDLAGSNQAIWNTYFYLREALKTQKPKLVVVDAYCVVRSTDYINVQEDRITNTFSIANSLDKIEAIKESAPETSWYDYILQFPVIHSRYEEITKADFEDNKGDPYYENWKGYYYLEDTVAQTAPNMDAISTDEVTPMTEKNEKYLRKIIELCQENDVDIQLMITPYVTNSYDLSMFNQVQSIADEYDVPFVNFNYYLDDMDLDFATGYIDTVHMNYIGSAAFSEYLGEYLTTNYDIPDRRGDSDYASWDDASYKYHQLLKDYHEIPALETLDDYLEAVATDDYYVTISCGEEIKLYPGYEYARASLLKYGIDLDSVEGAAVWVLKGGQVVYQSGDSDDYLYYQDIGEYDTLTVEDTSGYDSSYNAIKVPQIKINDYVWSRDNAGGINVIAYDTVLEKCNESALFSYIDNYGGYAKSN